MGNEFEITDCEFELAAEYQKDYEQTHLCMFCGDTISVAETYEQTIGIVGGTWTRYIKCFSCLTNDYNPNLMEDSLHENETYVIYAD